MRVNRYDPEVGSCMYGQDDGAYVTFADYEQAVKDVAKSATARDSYVEIARQKVAKVRELLDEINLRDAKIARLEDLLDQLSAAGLRLANEVLKPVDPPAQSWQHQKP